MKYYLAVDIGASSGRHIIGWKEDGVIKTKEMYRFKNSVTEENGHLLWDVDYLFSEVKNGIKKCIELYHDIVSLSIDTWAVDYVLLNNNQPILPVYAYRDKRTKEVIDEVHAIIPFEKLYQITGCQFQEFNTIYQLYWDKKHGRLDEATDMLMLPEYLMYRLTGVKRHEYTNASTTGMMSLKDKVFSEEIISKLGLKSCLFHTLDKPGTIVGQLKPELAEEFKTNFNVVLCATHDTASAVEGIGIPLNTPYISSGTWSLLGVKHEEGINSLEAYQVNYSNEYGPNYIRVQKNIMGLWIIQGLSKQLNLDFPTMVQMAKESEYQELFDVNDNVFLSSLNMKEEIKNWFMRNHKVAPVEDKDYINTVYRSLAYSYQQAIEELEKITEKTYEEIYIVGGGAKNQYLNQLTEEFTKKKIVALPIEATAIGNLKIQMEE